MIRHRMGHGGKAASALPHTPALSGRHLEVRYYPPHHPHDPAKPLEDNLRRAYPQTDGPIPAYLTALLRRLHQTTGQPPCDSA